MGGRKVVHVVGPDFRDRDLSHNDALVELARVYVHDLLEFAKTDLRHLRLTPIIGGILTGDHWSNMQTLTGDALQIAYVVLTDAQRERLHASRVNMCIYKETEYHAY